VGPHTEASIDDSKIKGKDENAGKTVSGSCKSGDHLEIKEEDGIPVLTPLAPAAACQRLGWFRDRITVASRDMPRRRGRRS
jgi:hypothetical protein